MKKKYSVFVSMLLAVLLLSQCKEEPTRKIYSPNKDSELTLLMRAMYDYYDEVKSDIAQDSLTYSVKAFEAIHTATATSPEKTKTDFYKGMSDIYLQSVLYLNETDKNDKQKAWNMMVDNCMNCHRQVCPGPMVKIKKLYTSI